MHNITVLGAGAFGTAMAQLLAENGHAVTLWCYEAETARSIKLMACNERYLPGVLLNDRIMVTTSLEEACAAPLIFEAIPVAHLRTILTQAQQYARDDTAWIVLSKGIEQDTFLLPSEIIKQLFPRNSLAVFSGPSYATEVAAQQPTQVTLATEHRELAQHLQTVVTNSWFTTEFSADVRGVQLCAAYKNVAAIYLGMLAGSGYGENTQARAFMHCLEEMKQVLQTLGGAAETAYGPAGLGDLLLTCYGALSRNRKLGIAIGKGEKLEQILKKLGTVPEGINSLVAFQKLAQKNNLTLPICSDLHEIIFNSKSYNNLLF